MPITRTESAEVLRSSSALHWLILGYPMLRSGLVPRGMAMLGLVGGWLILISGTLALFDVIDAGGSVASALAIPEFFWELSLGLYLTFEGFKPSPILSSNARPAGAGAGPSAAYAHRRYCCRKTHTRYDEHTAWAHLRTAAA